MWGCFYIPKSPSSFPQSQNLPGSKLLLGWSNMCDHPPLFIIYTACWEGLQLSKWSSHPTPDCSDLSQIIQPSFLPFWPQNTASFWWQAICTYRGWAAGSRVQTWHCKKPQYDFCPKMFKELHKHSLIKEKKYLPGSGNVGGALVQNTALN